jgi:ribosomal protein S18 acetylase RimI-like enzyme
MALLCLHDRAGIESWLRRDPGLHLYELGDLDDFFWPKTTWYGLGTSLQDVEAMALLYCASSLPVLVALGRERDLPAVRALLEELLPVLPRRFYTHLAPGSAGVLAEAFELVPHGLHDRMLLTDRARIQAVDTREAVRFEPDDEAELASFYASAYPGNWFDPRMLETGAYFGVRRLGNVVSVAGVHVLSRAHRIAALGNIATDPARRGQGLGRIATAAVCRALAEIDPIGLNVAADNEGAIALYRQLGFERVGCYEEHLATARTI